MLTRELERSQAKSIARRAAFEEDGSELMTRGAARRLAVVLSLLLPLAACDSKEKGALATEGCPACGEAATWGELRGADVDECSGAVAGATHPDVLYVHNDSGDSARFFAIGVDGVPRGEFDVSGAGAVDWEDVARGPCSSGGGSCLYLGDIGDNDKARADYAIYEVEEPAQIGAGKHSAMATAIPFKYPDGSHDAETLLVHPMTGVITVVTKVDKKSSTIYELPRPITPGATATLVVAGSIDPPVGSSRVTGGDVHPEGLGVLLRTHSDVFFFAMAQDQTVAQALAAPPCLLPAADEDQGEAIAWLPGGWDYVTLGEGVGAPIHGVSCAAP